MKHDKYLLRNLANKINNFDLYYENSDCYKVFDKWNLELITIKDRINVHKILEEHISYLLNDNGKLVFNRYLKTFKNENHD